MKNSNYLFILLCLLLSANLFSQTAPGIQWQKCFGGSNFEEANSIKSTSDGGYIIAGFTNSNDSNVSGNHGDYDYWVVKINASGNIQWQKCLGGVGKDQSTAVQQTTDGGYVVTGSSNSNDGDVSGNHGGYDIWVVKLSPTGNIWWQKCIGGSGGEGATAIQETNDNGFVIAASTSSNDSNITGNHGLSDGLIVKLNATGNIQWQKCLGGLKYDILNSIQQTKDNGYIVAGSSMSNDGDVSGNHGDEDFWIAKLNSAGSIQWQKLLGGSGLDRAYSVKETFDGRFIVGGLTRSNDNNVTGNHGVYDYWIVNLNSTGEILWQKCLGSTGSDEANDIIQTKDSGYVIAGMTDSNDGDVSGNHKIQFLDYWIVKLNSSGNIVWQKCLGGSSSDWAFSTQQSNDGGYIIAGYTLSNDSNVSNNHGKSDFWIVKLTEVNTGISETENNISSTIYPNPNNGNFVIENTLTQHADIKFTLVNMIGETVWIHTFPLQTGNNSTQINLNSLSQGMYFLHMEDEYKHFSEVKKVLVR